MGLEEQMRYRFGFIIEQTLGHITHSKNLQHNIKKDLSVEAYWGLPAWDTIGLESIIPVFRSNWTVRAGIRARRELASMKRETKLDALFFHTQVTAVLAQDYMKKIPTIVSLDATPIQYDSLGEYYAHSKGPNWLEKLKWRTNRDCFQAASHLVTWSEWAKQGLVDDYQVPSEKVSVIPPGVNIEEWNFPKFENEHKDRIKILFVGGNLERKGGLVLLEAFRELRSEGFVNQNGNPVEIELHLVTRDQIPIENGMFVYNKMQPNSKPLKDLYSRSDIFCLPTYGDCLPMVLSEAGASGLPLISTEVAAIPEIVQDGKTGFVVPIGDVISLTSALRKMITDHRIRNRMGKQASEVVREKYDAEKNTYQLLELLKSIVNIPITMNL
jgi:glycosyltransferase involved in cell wall biosynthesis